MIYTTINRLNTSRILEDNDLRRLAPSIFAENPWEEQSNKYKFIPTINVINALRDTGFYPVKAIQSNSRIEGKKEFTKHMIRFRQNNQMVKSVGDIFPEIVLVNSHDGTSSYRLNLGLFRLACSNGLVVSQMDIQSLRVIHMGRLNLCDQVVNISRNLLNESPKVLDVVNNWSDINLDKITQVSMANKSLEIYDSSIEIKPESLLRPRRRDDMESANGSRSLWVTFNVIQENLIKGGVLGKGTNGYYTHTRETKSVDRTLEINKGLWDISAEMAKLRGEAIDAQFTTPRITEPEETKQTEQAPKSSYNKARDLVLKYGSNWVNHINEINQN